MSCTETVGAQTIRTSQEDICIFPNTSCHKVTSQMTHSQSTIPCQNAQRLDAFTYVCSSSRMFQITAIKDNRNILITGWSSPVASACNLSTREAEAGSWRLQGCRAFEDTCVRPCLRIGNSINSAPPSCDC